MKNIATVSEMFIQISKKENKKRQESTRKLTVIFECPREISLGFKIEECECKISTDIETIESESHT